MICIILKYVPHTPRQIQLLVIVQVLLIIKLPPTPGPYLEFHLNDKNMEGGCIVYKASPTAAATHQGHVQHTSHLEITYCQAFGLATVVGWH
jgi:Mn2+/Fe2+ NRAMP family transporter